MQPDITNNLVLAEFYICASRLDFNEINSLLNIANFKERKSDSFFHEEFARDYWSVDTDYKNVEDINEQIDIILNLLEFKIEIINSIIKKFNAECGFIFAPSFAAI